MTTERDFDEALPTGHAQSARPVRAFSSGATRDAEDGKLDYEGFLSERVLRRYAEYMHKHRFQANGVLRDSDNWQKGIPVKVYMKSLWRHFMDVWRLHRLGPTQNFRLELEEALCACLFNVMGLLFEVTRGKE